MNNWADSTIAKSTLSGNESRIHGGGILNTSIGALRIDASTLSDNYGNNGGGIRNEGKLTITNSTASQNSARIGAGLQNWADMRVVSSTISGNNASQDGGGIHIDQRSSATTITGLVNTILAGNAAPEGPDCNGPLDSGGHNLIGNTGACSLTPLPGDLIGTATKPLDPLLAPLGDNGGPTQTQGLLPNSPAIDGGRDGSELETDQRGENRTRGLGPDIGAFER